MANPRILYDSRLADAAPAASGTATGFDVDNLTDWRPYTQWQPDALPATVTVDLGVGNTGGVDSWGVWGHDLATQGATIELRKSSDNFAADDNLVDTLTPSTDDPFVRYVSTADERYWRLRITGTTVPTLGIAFMGDYLELPQGLREGFDPLGRSVQGRFNRSVAGQPLGRTIDYEAWRQTLRFDLVTWSWLRATWEPAWEAHLKGTPFVFHWDPTGHTDEIRLVQAAEGFSTPHRAGSYAELNLELEGIFP